MDKPNKKMQPSRPAARLAAVQALYQMEFSSLDAETVCDEFIQHRLGATIEGHEYKPADQELFQAIVKGAVDLQREIDPLTDKAMKESWPLEKIDPILRAILRAATYELLARQDIPVKVILNEYVDIAKAFFIRDNESNFTNAVMDNIARKTREDEMPSESRPAKQSD
jgi:N utilization substance protein B